jgi:uncharacterized protein
MKQVVHYALGLALPVFKLDLQKSIHGISHWSRVWRNGRELCEAMDVEPTVPCLFAFLHDSQRYEDGRDIEHGERACIWLERLFVERKINCSASNFHLLCLAIAGHSFGETEADPVVQVCWDSDRLDLGRCGTMPDAMYLCTSHAKKQKTILEAWNRSNGICVTH